ncbi:hypothetical protein RHMOL_Rhmol04G0244300 [Rhododendron molle]|uniref:Uncharacterized protein n=1 Tax=Rhododendron molle TaxID=49168 RepID=A0ACC0P584_RHOML|nr:hypothetical protein RHMOL_Rhmol04G0244300 [Rhododendron molle]
MGCLKEAMDTTEVIEPTATNQHIQEDLCSDGESEDIPMSTVVHAKSHINPCRLFLARWMYRVVFVMDPVFDFYLGGDLKDDAVHEVDEVEVELGGNSNPLVSTNADVVDVQDDTVVEVDKNRLKRKLPPVPKPKKEIYRSPAWDHFNEIKEGGVTKLSEYNASSNDTAIRFLKRKTKDWKWTILDHDYLHVRCCEHILNLIVVEGLKDRNESILRVRDVVRVQAPSATPSVVVDEDCDDRLSLASEFDTYLEQEYSSVCSSKVDKYLNDLCERKDISDFDVVLWWKNNSNKYPILSQLARDVLAMAVSTVASEFAFSTGGRVLDPFRSSLSPSMVETLVCTQNWLLSTVPISLRQAMDKVEDLERGTLDRQTLLAEFLVIIYMKSINIVLKWSIALLGIFGIMISHLEVLTLDLNMRLNHVECGNSNFADFLMEIGTNPKKIVKLPSTKNKCQDLNKLLFIVYSRLNVASTSTPMFLIERTIISAKNEDVIAINAAVLNIFLEMPLLI